MVSKIHMLFNRPAVFPNSKETTFLTSHHKIINFFAHTLTKVQTTRNCLLSFSLGYKPFMLAIQNQIPILTKLLSTVIQQQQHVHQSHQQDASASASGPAAPARSRKTSSNQDSSGQPVIADAETGVNVSGDSKRETAAEAEGHNCTIS